MADNPLSTSDRILDASLQLFNEQGVQNVPLMRIAMHLGISPGHLAYHFKTKADIVMAVLPRIEADVQKGLFTANYPDEPFIAGNAAQHQIHIFRALWRYRFFFNALPQLLPGDRAVYEGFLRLQSNITGAMKKMLDDLIDQGHLRAVPLPNSTDMIARAAWMMWLSWLRFEQIENPDRKEARDEAVLDAIMHTFAIMQPYFHPEFADEMLAELNRLLKQHGSDSLRTTAGTARRRRSAGTRRPD
jgi:AcrR family transcriptional regulator